MAVAGIAVYRGELVHFFLRQDAQRYFVVSAQSEKATETLDKKVEKLIKKDMRETAVKRRFC
ncbi:hypothetical protein D7Y09_15570 [bacterium 1XD42-1]|nr:hypothetical protein D7X25_21535 [bacterium 1XD42-8]RKJ61570.1 hypothetical protein D7Y09_15570 [bacterium 1XD42-1]